MMVANCSSPRVALLPLIAAKLLVQCQQKGTLIPVLLGLHQLRADVTRAPAQALFKPRERVGASPPDNRSSALCTLCLESPWGSSPQNTETCCRSQYSLL